MAHIPRGIVRSDRNRLQRRLSYLAGENMSRRSDRAVQRVLALLTDENLVAAASQAGTQDCVTFECGIIAQVWDDPRLVNRRNQLAAQGIEVAQEVLETEYAGRKFVRDRLRVNF